LEFLSMAAGNVSPRPNAAAVVAYIRFAGNPATAIGASSTITLISSPTAAARFL
jgi:hypothetical protein